MKRWTTWIAVLAAVAACGRDGGPVERGEEDQKAGHTGGDREVVLTAEQVASAGIVVAPAEVMSVSGFVRATGEIQADPDRVVHLGSTVSGRVTMARGQVGERVRPGQVLATVIAAEAATASAEITAAEARLDLAREDVLRERSLVERGISPRRDLLAAEAELRQAEAAAEASRSRAGALSSRLVAPIAGVIAERRVNVGQAVEPGEVLYTIVDPENLVAVLDVYDRDMAAVEEGAAVTITTEAMADRIFHGRVRGISPVVDETTRTAKIRVGIDDADRRLRPGIFVTAVIEAPRAGGAGDTGIVVPANAVFRLGDRHVVFVAEDEGESGVRFSTREVEEGVRLDGEVEIRRGLAPGDRIAGRGGFSILSALRAGELGEGHD